MSNQKSVCEAIANLEIASLESEVATLRKLHTAVGIYLSEQGACDDSVGFDDDGMCENDDCHYCRIVRFYETARRALGKYEKVKHE